MSTTWCRIGCGSRRFGKASPHRRHCGGKHSSEDRTCSAGRNVRLWPLCPGCAPRLRPLGASFGRAARSLGESLEGGLLEFDEFSPSRRRSSAFSASNDAIRAACAAYASIVACCASTRRSSLASRSSTLVVTHSLDHVDLPELIEVDPNRARGRSGLHPVNAYPAVPVHGVHYRAAISEDVARSTAVRPGRRAYFGPTTYVRSSSSTAVSAAVPAVITNSRRSRRSASQSSSWS